MLNSSKAQRQEFLMWLLQLKILWDILILIYHFFLFVIITFFGTTSWTMKRKTRTHESLRSKVVFLFRNCWIVNHGPSRPILLINNLIRSNFIKTTYDISLDSQISFLPLGFSPLKDTTRESKGLRNREVESRKRCLKVGPRLANLRLPDSSIMRSACAGEIPKRKTKHSPGTPHN